MEPTSNDKAWLAALNGTGPAVDLETRQAKELGDFFQKQLADDLAAQMDPAMQLRIVNGLRASGLLSPGEPRPQKTGWTAWMDWLGLTGGGGWGMGSPRLAMVAGVVAAVVALPLVLDVNKSHPDQDVKSLRPDKSLGEQANGSRVVVSRDPAATAKALVEGLAAVGVQAELASAGAAATVEAQITTSNQRDASNVLAGFGFDAAPIGRLIIQFRSQ